MSAGGVRVGHLRSVDGRPVRLPRVCDPADALHASGWTVYTEPGPLVLAVVRLCRWLLRLALPVRRCAGCDLWLRPRLAGGLVDIRTGSTCCPVTGVPHAPWAVSGRG